MRRGGWASYKRDVREGRLERWLEEAIWGGILILVVAVPLAMSPAFLDMYRPPKLFLSQALILFLLLLTLLQGIVEGRLELPLTPLSLPALALLSATILSLAKALDIYAGIEEAFRLLTFILFFHLTARSLRSQAQLDRFFACSAVATSFVAVYGLLQAKGIDFITLERPFVPVSTLGNTGFAAEYLIASVPILLMAASNSHGWRRLLFRGSFLLAFAHLLLTKSRGGWVALTIALATMSLLGRKGSGARGQGSVKKRLMVIMALGGMAFILTLLFPGLWGQTLQRAASIFDPSDPPNRVRLLIWGSTLKMIAENPLFGVGAGNYELVYPLYRTVEEWRLSTRFVVGEAHNDYLQITAEMGLLGLGSFLWLLANLLRTAFRLASFSEEGIRRRGIGLFGALVALLIYAFFGFPLRNPASALSFWLLSGLLSKIEVLARERPLRSIRVSIGFAWAVAIPLFALASVLVFGQLLAELHLKRMKLLILQGKETEARAEYVKAIRRYFPLLYTQELRAKAFNDQRMLPTAAEAYRAALKGRPDDPRLHADLGAIYGEMGRFGEAEASLREALKLDPGLGEAWENLGNVHLLQERYLEAAEAYEEAAKKGRGSSAELRRKLGLARRLAGERTKAPEP